MLGQVRSGTGRRAVHVALDRLARLFHEAGADALDLPMLYPAEDLLDLYGEDLRTRAFVQGDVERGDALCLRPDFTVPVALAHREGGWAREAAYSYAGPVFRRQPSDADRPVEYLQAGIERFGAPEIAVADAQVFVTLHGGLQAMGVAAPEATIGDLSIVLAVLDALEMPAHRRAALKRHLWRPHRFQDLLRRACHPSEPSADRQLALTAGAGERRALMRSAGEVVGIRDTDDVSARLEALALQQSEPLMPERDAALVSDLLAIKGPAPGAAGRIRALTEGAGVDISTALTRFETRLALLLEQGCREASLTFDAGFGRTLEYYDGFVFELRAPGGEAHPPLAGGGRYDAMTVRLGAESPVPAIGGIIRPEAVLEVLA